MIKVTYAEVKAFHLCESGLKSAARKLGGVKAWNATPASFADLRSAGIPFDDLKWLTWKLAGKSDDAKRRLRLWTADCAAHVLHIYEEKGESDAPRKAIIAARARARREISDAAATAAYAAAFAAAGRRAPPLSAAYAAAYAAAGAAAFAAAFAFAAAAWGAIAAGRCATPLSDAALSTEEAWQLDRLVAFFSDQEPEDWPLPELQII